MTSSDRLQHQADQARAGLSSALDDLRSSVTTTALTNGAMTFAKDGSSALAKAAVDRAMAHPLAALLIGAGVTMLMASGENGTAGKAVGNAAAAAQDNAKAAGKAVTDAASTAVAGVGAAVTGAAQAATGTYDKAKDAVVKGQEKMMRTMHDAEDLAANAKTRLEQFAQEQPILVAALGVAFGAALGASLPVTAAERTYLGAAGKKITETGTEVAKNVADSVTGAVAGPDVAGKVGEVAEAVKSSIGSALPS